MSFHSLYRVSFYLMLFFATLTMSVDATDSKIAFLFPVGVAVAAVVAYMTVDRSPRFGLSRPLANLLAIGSIALIYVEYSVNENLLLLALAHWLVYLQLIKMFLPKRVEDDWFLFLLGLMQVLVGSVVSQSDQVGLTLFTWALLALWVLGVFALRREALRYRLIDEASEQTREWKVEPYPGLIDPAFVLSALRVTALTVALGGVIFFLMPRRTNMARAQSSAIVPKHMTGFEDEVQLGQLGEILENDSVVMTVQLEDDRQRIVEPPAEPLWRGVSMARYANGRWQKYLRPQITTFPTRVPRTTKGSIHQRIRLEPNDSAILFALRPILHASAAHQELELNALDGSLYRPTVRQESYDYLVESDLDPAGGQPLELRPQSGLLRDYRQVPDEILEPLRRITEPLVRQIPPEQVEKRARALELYLRETGGFGYTLHMEPVDPKIDPILDFLQNRKQGHCEYFGSALALMLRSIGIPARLVNGFKGGDWNDIAHVLSVRQKHAHTWVEAYVAPGDTSASPGRPRWLTLDPTPGDARDVSVAQVGGFRSHFRQVLDLIRYVWVFYVVGFNAERQERLIYEPLRNLATKARRGFAMMGQSLRAGIKLFHFPTSASFFSGRGFVVSFVGLLFLIALFRGAQWLVHRTACWMRGGEGESSANAAGEIFYRRLAQLLAEVGLERPPAETQNEFARRASVFLTGRGIQTGAVADVPRLVVDAYYRVRFGHEDLAPDAAGELSGRLDALEKSLRPDSA